MYASSRQVHSASWTPTMGAAELKLSIKKAAVTSTSFYRPPDVSGARQPLLPCTCIGMVGDKGSGKSSYLSALFSSLAEHFVHVSLAGSGQEAETGTMRCVLMPLHMILWPDAKVPPAYVYVWDTVGLGGGAIVDATTAHSALGPILTGKIRPGASSVNASQDEVEHRFPRPSALLFVSSHTNCLSVPANGSAPVIKVVSDHLIQASRDDRKTMMPMPLVVVVTKCDVLERTVNKPDEAQFDWDITAESDELGKISVRVADVTGVPQSRVHTTFGLDRLSDARFKAGDEDDDPREQAVLLPLLVAMREGLFQLRYNSNGSVRAAAAGCFDVCGAPEQVAPDGHSSIYYASAKELGGILARHQSPDAHESAKSALRVITDELVRQDITGRGLLELGTEDALREFLTKLLPADAPNRGAVDVVCVAVRPYRCLGWHL